VLITWRVIVEEKQKRMKDLTPEERREIWEDFRAQLEEYEKSWRDEFIRRMREVENNASPGSFQELLKLIAIVQDKSPEAGEAIFQLIERHFRRRWVLYVTNERLRLEDMWNLDLSLDPETNELNPLNYERDIAPLPLLEAIHGYKETFVDPKTLKPYEVFFEGCGDVLLGDLKNHIKKTMRNRIVRGGAQGRNIDTKEVEREYRLKELPDKTTMIWRPGIKKYIAWEQKDKIDKSSERGSSGDESLWDQDSWDTPKTKDPWDPREVIDIAEEDKPLWDVISKAIPLLDDIDQLLVKSIMYKIPIVKISKETGIPEGTLRSRKSRLRPKVLKIATKYLSSSVVYMERSSKKDPYKKGQKPDNIGP